MTAEQNYLLVMRVFMFPLTPLLGAVMLLCGIFFIWAKDWPLLGFFSTMIGTVLILPWVIFMYIVQN